MPRFPERLYLINAELKQLNLNISLQEKYVGAKFQHQFTS